MLSLAPDTNPSELRASNSDSCLAQRPRLRPRVDPRVVGAVGMLQGADGAQADTLARQSRLGGPTPAHQAPRYSNALPRTGEGHAKTLTYRNGATTARIGSAFPS